MRIALIMFAILVVPAVSIADQQIEDCSKGAAYDSFQCFSKKLEHQEKKLDQLNQKILSEIESMWGEHAKRELKQRFIATNISWRKYRDGYCERDYYTQAPTHPPSLSMVIAACKLEKTEVRISELANMLQKKDGD